jgi:hypothetical protein
MELINSLKNRAETIEEMKESLFELQYGLDGAEVEYQGEEAIVMDIDWVEKQVLLNYDDENMEWVSFE